MLAICAARHSACTGQLPHIVFPFLIFSQCSRFLPSRPIKYGSSSRLQAACPIHADRGAGLYPPRISRSVYTAGLTPFFICSRIASVAGVGFLGCSRVISFCSFAIKITLASALFHTPVILPSISRVVRCLSPYPPLLSAAGRAAAWVWVRPTVGDRPWLYHPVYCQ